MSKAKAKTKDDGRDEVVGGASAKPQTIKIPDEVRIKRQVAEPESKITESAAVIGDQRLMVIDILNNVPIEVVILEGIPLDPEGSGTLVFIESNVTHETLSYHRAKGKFAAKPDGTVIYNGRGFDEVSATADYDLVDIVKLADHLSGNKKSKK